MSNLGPGLLATAAETTDGGVEIGTAARQASTDHQLSPTVLRPSSHEMKGEADESSAAGDRCLPPRY
jgi:hypothetical protein